MYKLYNTFQIQLFTVFLIGEKATTTDDLLYYYNDIDKSKIIKVLYY